MAADTLVRQALLAIQTAAEHGAANEHGAEQAQQAASTHAPELPNFVHVLHHYFPDNGLVNALYSVQDIVFIIIIIGVITFFFRTATRHRAIIPGRLQAMAEIIVEGLLGVVCGILGDKEGRRYFPFLGSLFIFIVCMNWFGLVPLMRSPTANIITTAGLAISVFFFVQFTAIKRLGIGGFFFHLLGEPKDAIGWAMTPLFFPLHVLEEFIKPLSLACRLYGNVYGEDVLLGVGMVLGIMMMPLGIGAIIGVPLHFPFVLLSILLGTIQALVFTLLASVYISMVMPHHEHHEEEAEH